MLVVVVGQEVHRLVVVGQVLVLVWLVLVAVVVRREARLLGSSLALGHGVALSKAHITHVSGVLQQQVRLGGALHMGLRLGLGGQQQGEQGRACHTGPPCALPCCPRSRPILRCSH